MKLNHLKMGTCYSHAIEGVNYIFGWYLSGKAFIAKDEELLTFSQAYGLVPRSCFTMSDRFFVGLQSYAKSIDGIVRYLIDKYKKD